MSDSSLCEMVENKLSCFMSPFTWDLPDINEKIVDQYLKFQLEIFQNIDEEHEFKWNRFILQLFLGYELWHQLGDIVTASHFTDSCVADLEQLLRSGCSEQLFTSTLRALQHVALSTRAHLHLANRHLDKAAETIALTPLISEMSISAYAGLWGIKAAILRHYKPEGHQLALEAARKARDLDPHQGEWHFIVANCLGRIRRLERGTVISREEWNAMERAFALQTDATYTCHLAQMYVDHARNVYRSRSTADGWLETSILYGKKAADRIKEALTLRPHCPKHKIRMAHILLNIPVEAMPDSCLAKQLLDEASVDQPNSPMLYHDLGRYYHKYQEDPHKAMECLEKAHQLNNYPAFIYLTSLRWKYSEQANLIRDISAAMKQYTTQSQTAELYVYLGAAHILLTDDWHTAVQCFNKSLNLDPSARYMKRFHGVHWLDKPNLLEVVTNELRLKDNTSENDDTFNNFILKVADTNMNLLLKPTDPGLFFNFKTLQLKHKFDESMVEHPGQDRED